jgi:hypothetical protein
VGCSPPCRSPRHCLPSATRFRARSAGARA